MSTPTRIGVVFNPSKGAPDELEGALASFDGTVTWHETDPDDPGIAAARAAIEAGAELILAAGGDGTVRAVAAHLADSGAAVDLGIVPLGTGNLLARNLEVPLGDVAAAVHRAITAEPRTIDVGWVETGEERSAFVVMAGFGIDAHMITETDDELKGRAGWVAYVEALGRAVSASEVIDVRLVADDDEATHGSAHTVIVGNCGTLQGGFTLLPDADPTDGALDLLVLEADGVGGWMDTLKNVVWDNGIARAFDRDADVQSSEHVSHRRVRSLSIELAEPRVVEVDGDEVGETTTLDITVQAGALRVC